MFSFESFVLLSNPQNNIDVWSNPFKKACELDINGKVLNCAQESQNWILIGCQYKHIFLFQQSDFLRDCLIKPLKSIQTTNTVSSLTLIAKEYAYLSYNCNRIDLLSFPDLKLNEMATLPFGNKVNCLVGLT